MTQASLPDRIPGAAPVVAAMLLAVLFSGCDKLPQPEVASPPAPSPPPSSPPPVTPPAPPRSPQQIIDEFRALNPLLRNDEHLEELASLPEGLDGITTLDLRGSTVTTAGARHLPRFPALRELDLSSSRIDGSALSYVAQIGELKSLQLDGLAFDDAALAPLAALAHLEELTLNGTSITDGGFEYLKDLPQLRVLRIGSNSNLRGNGFTALVRKNHFRDLRELSVNRTEFGYYGLQELDRLKELEVLHAHGANVSDDSLEGVQTCVRLRVLDLGDNKVSDGGLRKLARLKELEELQLAGNPAISDDGLNFLKTHTGLRRLTLDGTRVTPDAARRLKERFLKQTTITIEGQEI